MAARRSRPVSKDTPKKKEHRRSSTSVTRRGQWQAKFLAALRENGNVRLSCEVVNIQRMTAYRWYESDATFAEGWENALQDHADLLEQEAVRRAVEGDERNIYDKDGNLKEVIHTRSDILLIFMLKALRPAKFRDNVNVESRVTGNVIFTFGKPAALNAPPIIES